MQTLCAQEATQAPHNQHRIFQALAWVGGVSSRGGAAGRQHGSQGGKVLGSSPKTMKVVPLEGHLYVVLPFNVLLGKRKVRYLPPSHLKKKKKL